MNDKQQATIDAIRNRIARQRLSCDPEFTEPKIQAANGGSLLVSFSNYENARWFDTTTIYTLIIGPKGGVRGACTSGSTKTVTRKINSFQDI